MIIPVNVDKSMDEKLIEWLSGKRNRSAFIRDTLYEKMESETTGAYPSTTRMVRVISEDTGPVINKNTVDSINKLLNY